MFSFAPKPDAKSNTSLVGLDGAARKAEISLRGIARRLKKDPCVPVAEKLVVAPAFITLGEMRKKQTVINERGRAVSHIHCDPLRSAQTP